MLSAARRRSGDLLRRYGDLVLALGLSALALADIWTNDYIIGSRPLLSGFSLCATLALAWRRKAPFAVTLTVSAALLLQVAIEPTPHPPDVPFLAWLITSYSVAAHAALPRALASGAVLVVAVDLWTSFSPNDGGTDLVFISVILAGFWVAGRVVRSRNLLAAELAERTKELESEREERARLAVAEERARIARELHDIVAHTLSVIAVLAGAERLVQRVGTARDTLESIERTSREALAEMGRLLGMLRADGDPAELGPQPSLTRIDELLAGVRNAGLDVELVAEGEPRSLPAGMDVSAYRIVQEALTNSLKHGRCKRARVSLRWSPTLLEIEVADDGIGPAADPGPGHGLLGLRERAALFDGVLVTGRSELGGFLLAARLPLQAT
jgi:signal transduction histidine kinase